MLIKNGVVYENFLAYLSKYDFLDVFFTIIKIEANNTIMSYVVLILITSKMDLHTFCEAHKTFQRRLKLNYEHLSDIHFLKHVQE